jgi:hypothetical protein
MRKPTALELKVQELQLRALRSRQTMLAKGNAEVPAKKKSKPVGYKMQNTFEKSLKGVPGGSFSRGAESVIINMIAAKGTGTQVRKEGIGVLRSARNANTTQGNYTRSVVKDETDQIVSDAQGRVEFGR